MKDAYLWKLYSDSDRVIHYIDRTETYFTKTIDGKKGVIITLDIDKINSYANTIKSEHERVFRKLQNLLLSINISYNDDLKNQIIESIQHLNQVASDLEFMNDVLVNRE